MLAASGASFCLFALMALMIAGETKTQLVTESKFIKIEKPKPNVDPYPLRTDKAETQLKSDFIDTTDAPVTLQLYLPEDLAFETNVPFERVMPVTHIETSGITVSPFIDRDAMLLAVSNPMYPYKAEKNLIEGHVIVAMNVDSEGRVDDAWVIESSPAGYFEDCALAAAKKFKYRPRYENGRTVTASNLQYRWDFNLPDKG